jgi:hypothetical protein
MGLGAKMDFILKRLSFVNARLKLVARIEADLHAQFLELTDLREQLREKQVSADIRKATRARRPAPVTIASAA